MDSCAAEEEQLLISWFNSVLEPSAATVHLLSDEVKLASKLIEIGQPLLEDCRSMKRKLESSITWDRFVTTSTKQIEWKLRVKRLLISYRKCWLKVALQVLKLIEEESEKNAAPKQTPSSHTDLLQFLVSSSLLTNHQKWAHKSSVRFLTVLYFLDRVRSELKSLFSHQPSLFVVNEETEANKMAFKALTSSEQVLSQFVLTNLSAGSGAQFRAQLQSIAYSLHYSECHAEITCDFSIKSTALSPSHLCDGIRFAKLSEVLFSNESTSTGLVKSLKYPAKSIPDRIANISRLFSSFLWTRLVKYDTKVWHNLDMQQMAEEVANGYSRVATLRLLNSLRQVELQLKMEQYYQPHLPAIVATQRRFREKLDTARCRKEFLRLKGATVLVQQKFRAQLAARKARSSYLKLKAAARLVQKRFRLKRNMVELKAHVNGLAVRFKQAATTIQRHWRGASTRWRIEKQILDGSSSILGHSELMGFIASIELHAAIPSGPSLADKAETAFGRLKTVAGKINSEKDFGAVLKNSVLLEKLASDLYTLQECAEISLEIRAKILKKEQQSQQQQHFWSLLTFLANLLQHINRSEEHKSLALTSLSLIYLLVLPIRMKSIAVSITTFVPSGTWHLMGETILQLMHNYINYPSNIQIAMAILRLLVERNAIGKTLLTESRLWVRLVERIKEKYRIDCACNSDSCDALANCSCHLVKSEFLQMISTIE